MHDLIVIRTSVLSILLWPDILPKWPENVRCHAVIIIPVLYVFVKSVGARVCNSNGECLKGIPLVFCILTHHHFSHKPLKLQGTLITL